MELSFQMVDGELRVLLYGELDHHVARGMGEKIDLQILLKAPKSVCLDFEKLSFMDSSGLAVIMGRRRTCQNIGIEFSVSGLHGAIRKVLMLSGLQKYVKIKENSYES